MVLSIIIAPLQMWHPLMNEYMNILLYHMLFQGYHHNPEKKFEDVGHAHVHTLYN